MTFDAEIRMAYRDIIHAQNRLIDAMDTSEKAPNVKAKKVAEACNALENAASMLRLDSAKYLAKQDHEKEDQRG